MTNTGKMNRITLCLFLSMIFFTAASQKIYFVYLQTETDQPFFVKMNEKLHSSTASGYLILSKLRDSSYNFSVGFPQNKWPEQHFSVAVNKKDHGYLLKNFGEKGWGLFDLQSMNVQMAMTGTSSANPEIKTEKKEVSAFTDILSKAADDPTLKEKPVQQKTEEKKVEITPPEQVKKEEVKAIVPDTQFVKKEEPKEEIKEQPLVKKDEPKVEPKDTLLEKKEEIPVVPVTTYKQSVVTKRSESSTTEGFGLVFIDEYEDGKRDTIRLLIPNPKQVVNIIKEEPKEEKKFLDISTDTAAKTRKIIPEIKKDTMSRVESKSINEIAVNKPVSKNNCKEFADEPDFFKLRKKMAGVTSDEDMIAEARKVFKTKCFTVSQLRNLGNLFLDDAGKYKFFDVAYAYVSDDENFATLQSTLKEEYYINRFKAMLRN